LHGKMKSFFQWISLLIALLVCPAAHAQTPIWIDVPMIWAPAGNYTCITRPTGDQRIAIISCDPNRFNQFPQPVQRFLITHEHGHVYQIAYTPTVLYGPYAEYDADCYAATYLATTDVATLTAAVHWFETVFRNQGGDSTHGTGLQMAQRARQCAAQVGVNIARQEAAPLPAGVRFLNVATGQSANKAKLPLGSIVSHGPDDISDKGTPSFATALEMIVESAHSAFWEVSTHSGAVRADISRAIGGHCRVGGGRMSVVCEFARNDAASGSEVKEQVERTLDSSEWAKKCANEECSIENFAHPNDQQDHTSVLLDASKMDKMVLRIEAAKREAHEHDGFKLKKGDTPAAQ
jgi:hypothetical protein